MLQDKPQEKKWQCCIDGDIVSEQDIYKHKQKYHPDRQNYGLMWFLPDIDKIKDSITVNRDIINHETEIYQHRVYNMWKSWLMQQLMPVEAKDVVSLGESGIPIIESEFLARELGVKKVYIRDEGKNPTGSMKDYIISCGTTKGRQEGYNHFTAVSCGNHALSAAHYVKSINGKIIVFITSGSTKAGFLNKIPNAHTFRVKTNGRDSIYEEVYERFYNAGNNRIYNLNVSNEFMIDSAKTVALEMALSGKEMPTHFISCAGNGTYIGGVGKGFLELKQLGIIKESPKCVAVGMKGGFPFETALDMNVPIKEYKDFLIDEKKINYAEGTMAIGCYSMPQAILAIKSTNGFTLGGLENEALIDAYIMLSKDRILMEAGIVQEPTAIQSLAAVLKHSSNFSKEDIVLLSFTGHGAKNLKEISEMLGEKYRTKYEILATSAVSKQGRPDLVVEENLILDSQISQSDLDEIINKLIAKSEHK